MHSAVECKSLCQDSSGYLGILAIFFQKSTICAVSLKFASENMRTFSHFELAIILMTSFEGKIEIPSLYAILKACNRKTV